jgi:hypothetical protein
MAMTTAAENVLEQHRTDPAYNTDVTQPSHLWTLTTQSGVLSGVLIVKRPSRFNPIAAPDNPAVLQTPKASEA